MTYTGLENFTDDELIKKVELSGAAPLEQELAKRLDERNEEILDWEKYEAERE